MPEEYPNEFSSLPIPGIDLCAKGGGGTGEFCFFPEFVEFHES